MQTDFANCEQFHVRFNWPIFTYIISFPHLDIILFIAKNGSLL